ncbi:MAG: S-methyl-5-thioribose-1-phosphate isomerase [Gammaproteobacteria bacterium]|nr:S-methyl-5-thioribose-1-phosphate isomerase [Gammaproteobacteria bacterium]MDH5801255.1 S-methyl-5-thioribose-1-phosphate isomerase [Gammaproteobacteria bacterium]
MAQSFQAIQWTGGSESRLRLLDQRLLPHQETYLDYNDSAMVADAIRDMVVRGAPAIGICAAYAVVLAAKQRLEQAHWRAGLQQDLDFLLQSRPTAVNLQWALQRQSRVIEQYGGAEPQQLLRQLEQQAERIHAEDLAANLAMGELGAAQMKSSCNVLTHCNAGALATGGYGTALGVIRSAFKQGKINKVYADETRPWLQGARLTAWELLKDGIPVELQIEGAAAHLMQQGVIQWVIVGSDRIAANGDVANKIGTYSLAVLARYHKVKFMVVAPTSTVDMSLEHGGLIPIEQRSPQEVLCLAGQDVAATGATARNPAFDVTPAALVDCIVTEKGVVYGPNRENMMAMMQND